MDINQSEIKIDGHNWKCPTYLKADCCANQEFGMTSFRQVQQE